MGNNEAVNDDIIDGNFFAISDIISCRCTSWCVQIYVSKRVSAKWQRLASDCQLILMMIEFWMIIATDLHSQHMPKVIHANHIAWHMTNIQSFNWSNWQVQASSKFRRVTVCCKLYIYPIINCDICVFGEIDSSFVVLSYVNNSVNSYLCVYRSSSTTLALVWTQRVAPYWRSTSVGASPSTQCWGTAVVLLTKWVTSYWVSSSVYRAESPSCSICVRTHSCR
jgi:hypothetical protein